MASLALFLSIFLCLLLPVFSLLVVLLGRKIENKQIVYLIFAGVGSRFLFIFLNIAFAGQPEIPVAENGNMVSPILATVAVFLLVYVYSNVIIKALIRQSEIVSRFFLDSLPTQQMGADLEFRQQAISIDKMRSKKSDLLTNSLQLGGLEGVLKWLIADIWLILGGTALLSLIKFRSLYRDTFSLDTALAMLNLFSTYSLFLVTVGIIGAFPIIRFLSLGVNEDNSKKKVTETDIELVVYSAIVLSFLFLVVVQNSGLIGSIIFSVLAVGIFRLVILNRRRNSVAQFYFIRNADSFKQVPNFNGFNNLSTCKLELPIKWLPVIDDILPAYLSSSEISHLPNIISSLDVTFTASNRIQISFGGIRFEKEQTLDSIYLPVMEPRILKTLGAMPFFAQILKTSELKLSCLTSLSVAIKEFNKDFAGYYPSPISVGKLLKFLVETDQLIPSTVNQISVEKNDNLSQIIGVIYLFGYTYLPLRIFAYMLEMIAQEREDEEVLKTIISELIKEAPESIAGGDSAFRVISIEKEISGQDESNLLERIVAVAKDLEDRGLAPLILRVPDIGDRELKPFAEDLKNKGIDFRFLDSGVKIARACYPLGIL